MSIGRIIAIADSIAKYIGASFFEAYIATEDSTFYLGDRLINDEDLVSLRNDTEEQFYHEMNSFYE